MSLMRANQLMLVARAGTSQQVRTFWGDYAFNKKYYNKIDWENATMTETLPDGRTITSLDPRKIPVLREKQHALWQVDNHFMSEYHMKEHVQHNAKSYKFWKLMTFTAVPLSLAISLYIALKVDMAAHHEPRPPFVAYDHLRLRRNVHPYFWDHTNTRTLLHNPIHNALPDGYETPASAKQEAPLFGIFPMKHEHHEETHEE